MARNPLSPYRSGLGIYGGTDPFTSLHREMNRLFDDAYRGGSGVGDLIQMEIDVSETENEYRVKAELPGVSEDDVDLRLEDNVLTIRGEKKFERTEGGEKEDYHFVERSYGTFQRSLRLPTRVDTDNVRADCENGVLTINLPKAQQQEQRRRIQVQGGGRGGNGKQSGQKEGKQSGQIEGKRADRDEGQNKAQSRS